jgi:hypothetical protein
VLILGLLLILGVEGLRRHGRELDALERDLTAEFTPIAHDPRPRLPLAAAGDRHR